MKTDGEKTLEYFAVARPGFVYHTRLDGKFETRAGAKEEQQQRGGRVVKVRQHTTWTLAENETSETTQEAATGEAQATQ